MLTLPTLTHLRSYQNTFILQQYLAEHPDSSLNQAKQLFEDLLSWMWISVYRREREVKTHLFGPLLQLDHMWHIFILNTQIYTDFCNTYFQGYFHHEVEPIGSEPELSENDLLEFLEDCYDHLGKEWIVRNFGEVLQT